MSTATGIGSWPGEDMRTALRWVRDVLGEVESDGTRFGLPYLPELPARGPGADMIFLPLRSASDFTSSPRRTTNCSIG